ncbi:hypothetical protein [Paenibacillus sp. S150]|uniref:hypothetical protein n=1 Tax=Paenibacillus sp. S150 TaxID=2749826 RepID=UPI001C59F58A|nr:hypothetical protein [Paenibacillus sp. S150]MBW4085756.1 hypothetical protein [Paenibacillus sp. S150]
MRKMRKLYLGLFISVALSLTSASSMVYGAANDVKSYTYDSSGRLTFIDSRSERMSLQYDQQGNLISKYNEADSNSLFGTPVVGAVSDAVKAYTSTQGSGNWYYQQWDGNVYTDLQYKNNQWEGKTPFTIISGAFQHPDQTDSVRKWVAPKSGNSNCRECSQI